MRQDIRDKQAKDPRTHKNITRRTFILAAAGITGGALVIKELFLEDADEIAPDLPSDTGPEPVDAFNANLPKAPGLLEKENNEIEVIPSTKLPAKEQSLEPVIDYSTTFSVVDENGEALSGANVQIRPYKADQESKPLLTLKTNQEGKVTWTLSSKDQSSLPQALQEILSLTKNKPLLLSVRAKHYYCDSPVTTCFELDPVKAHQDIEIRLSRGALFQGKVIDEKGEPVSGADIKLSIHESMVPKSKVVISKEGKSNEKGELISTSQNGISGFNLDLAAKGSYACSVVINKPYFQQYRAAVTFTPETGEFFEFCLSRAPLLDLRFFDSETGEVIEGKKLFNVNVSHIPKTRAGGKFFKTSEGLHKGEGDKHAPIANEQYLRFFPSEDIDALWIEVPGYEPLQYNLKTQYKPDKVYQQDVYLKPSQTFTVVVYDCDTKEPIPNIKLRLAVYGDDVFKDDFAKVTEVGSSEWIKDPCPGCHFYSSEVFPTQYLRKAFLWKVSRAKGYDPTLLDEGGNPIGEQIEITLNRKKQEAVGVPVYDCKSKGPQITKVYLRRKD